MLSPATIRFLEGFSSLLGWAYFVAWSISFWPQPWKNYLRKSTSGTSPIFPIFNVSGFTSYSLSQLLFYCSPVIQEQYRQRHNGKDNLVRTNDVLFALHALFLSCLTLSQFWPKLWDFEKRIWRVGREAWSVVIGTTIIAAVMVVIVLIFGNDGGYDANGWAWIDVVEFITYIKILFTVIKYMPQVRTNYENKSTAGWSIVQILLDLAGGILSTGQLIIDASLQGSIAGVMGNKAKFLLGNVSIVFDVIFIVQHYIVYRVKGEVLDEENTRDEEGRALLSNIDYETDASSGDGEERTLIANRDEEAYDGPTQAKDDEESSKDGKRRRLTAGRDGISSSGSSTIWAR